MMMTMMIIIINYGFDAGDIGNNDEGDEVDDDDDVGDDDVDDDDDDEDDDEDEDEDEQVGRALEAVECSQL